MNIRMKLSVALFTFLTLHVCHIRASALEEHNLDPLEEQDIEDLDMELMEELEEEDESVDSSEEEEDVSTTDFPDLEDLKARPSKHPFCIRTFRSGWGGKCLNCTQMEGQSCDYIYGINNSPINTQCANDQYCCVDCSVPKQKQNCPDYIPGLKVLRECSICPDYVPFKTMESGCTCCGTCPNSRRCKKKGGYCSSKKQCLANGGNPRWERWCKGKGCFCCFPKSKTY